MRYGCSLVGDAQAKILLMHGGFNNVYFDGLIRPKQLAEIPLEYIIPAYLRFVSKRRFKLQEQASWYETVLKDMAKWIETEGGDSTSVLAAMKYVTVPESENLAEKGITAMYRQGILRAGCVAHTKTFLPVSFNANGLLLTRQQFLQACAAAKVIPPDVSYLPETIKVARSAFEP